jgi:hypothetical protein
MPGQKRSRWGIAVALAIVAGMVAAMTTRGSPTDLLFVAAIGSAVIALVLMIFTPLKVAHAVSAFGWACMAVSTRLDAGPWKVAALITMILSTLTTTALAIRYRLSLPKT